jgi:predicted nucleotidyltransferase
MEPTSVSSSTETVAATPSREELQAELLPLPEAPPPPEPVLPPGVEAILEIALRHVRGKRGGDLVGIVLVGSGAKRALTAHSDLDLIALVKSPPEHDEIVRVADRQVDIRYREAKAVEEELPFTPRLPGLLRKARVLYEVEGVATRLRDKAQQAFRQGVPAPTLNERIRLKADCLHWLGKAEDLKHDLPAAQFVFNGFLDSALHAFFRLRGFWPTAPAEAVRFVAARDQTLGDTLEQAITSSPFESRLAAGQKLAAQLFHDVPNPQRID